MDIKETSISTQVFDAVWTGKGWDVEIICDIEGTIWADTLPAMGSDEAIAVLETMTTLYEFVNQQRDEMEGF